MLPLMHSRIAREEKTKTQRQFAGERVCSIDEDLASTSIQCIQVRKGISWQDFAHA